MEAARELSRRRVLAQDQNHERDLKIAYAECFFLDQYGRVPKLEDLQKDKRRLSFVTHDDSGRSIRVVCRDEFPFRVYQRFMDADLYVFVKTSRSIQKCEPVGWLPRSQVEECVTHEFPSKFPKGKPDYAYEVEIEYLVPLPPTFDFVDPCPHFEKWGGIWDYTIQAWNCFGCERFVVDRYARETARIRKPEQCDQEAEASEES